MEKAEVKNMNRKVTDITITYEDGTTQSYDKAMLMSITGCEGDEYVMDVAMKDVSGEDIETFMHGMFELVQHMVSEIEEE